MIKRINGEDYLVCFDSMTLIEVSNGVTWDIIRRSNEDWMCKKRADHYKPFARCVISASKQIEKLYKEHLLNACEKELLQ